MGGRNQGGLGRRRIGWRCEPRDEHGGPLVLSLCTPCCVGLSGQWIVQCDRPELPQSRHRLRHLRPSIPISTTHLLAVAAAAAAAGVVGCDTDNFLPFFPAASVHILLLLGSVGPQKKVNKGVSSVAAAAALPDHLILRGEHGCREVGFLDFVEADDDFDGIHENLSEFLDLLPSLLVLNSIVVDTDEDDDDSSEDPESHPYDDEQPPPVPAFSKST